MLATAAIISPLFAQTTQPQNETTPNVAQPQATEHRKQLAAALELLGQVAVLTPGKGFESIQLGERFTELEQRWGQPHKSQKSGFFRPRLHWAYQLDDHTWVEFIGKQVILRIHVYGKPLSVLRTDKNLGFSSSPENIVQALGEPKKSPNYRLSYPSKGIDFQFSAQGKLQVIEAYPPAR